MSTPTPKHDTISWSFPLEKVDTVQAKAQIEALRAIAEELRYMNVHLAEDLAREILSQPGFISIEQR